MDTMDTFPRVRAGPAAGKLVVRSARSRRVGRADGRVGAGEAHQRADIGLLIRAEDRVLEPALPRRGQDHPSVAANLYVTDDALAAPEGTRQPRRSTSSVRGS